MTAPLWALTGLIGFCLLMLGAAGWKGKEGLAWGFATIALVLIFAFIGFVSAQARP